MLRSTFSTTTIASSTTMPTASTSPKQGQVVEGDTERREDRERSHQGNGHRDDRNDGRAPILQEEEHDTDHQQDRHENRDDDLMDRLPDEDVRIVDDGGVDAGRKILLQRLHRVADLLIDRDRVGAGLGVDDEGRRIAAVLISRAAVVRSVDLDPGDVAHARHASSIVGLDDDVRELLGRREAAKRLDIDLISPAARGGRLVQDTGRDLQVLRAQRRKHVVGAEIVGRGLVRIETDAHRIFATALDLDVADPGKAREHVLDVQGRVIRQVKRVARRVGRVQVNGHEDAGYRLAHLHAEALHVVGSRVSTSCTRFCVSICDVEGQCRAGT